MLFPFSLTWRLGLGDIVNLNATRHRLPSLEPFIVLASFENTFRESIGKGGSVARQCIDPRFKGENAEEERQSQVR